MIKCVINLKTKAIIILMTLKELKLIKYFKRLKVSLIKVRDNFEKK